MCPSGDPGRSCEQETTAAPERASHIFVSHGDEKLPLNMQCAVVTSPQNASHASMIPACRRAAQCIIPALDGVNRGNSMANLEAIEQEMRSLGWWYQHFELPNGSANGERPGTGLRCQGALELHRAACADRPRRQNGAGLRGQRRILFHSNEAARCQPLCAG